MLEHREKRNFPSAFGYNFMSHPFTATVTLQVASKLTLNHVTISGCLLFRRERELDGN